MVETHTTIANKHTLKVALFVLCLHAGIGVWLWSYKPMVMAIIDTPLEVSVVNVASIDAPASEPIQTPALIPPVPMQAVQPPVHTPPPQTTPSVPDTPMPDTISADASTVLPDSTEPVAEPIEDLPPKPIESPEPVVEPEPIPEPKPDPTPEPVVEPEPALEPILEPAPEPVVEPKPEPVPLQKPATPATSANTNTQSNANAQSNNAATQNSDNKAPASGQVAPAGGGEPVQVSALEVAWVGGPPRVQLSSSASAMVRRASSARVGMRLFVAANGRIERIDIIQSSGVASIDQEIKNIVMRKRITARKDGRAITTLFAVELPNARNLPKDTAPKQGSPKQNNKDGDTQDKADNATAGKSSTNDAKENDIKNNNIKNNNIKNTDKDAPQEKGVDTPSQNTPPKADKQE